MCSYAVWSWLVFSPSARLMSDTLEETCTIRTHVLVPACVVRGEEDFGVLFCPTVCSRLQKGRIKHAQMELIQ